MSDSKEQDEHDRDPELSARIDALPREIEPQRDLWKGVEARIVAKKRRSSAKVLFLSIGTPLAAAAAVFAIYTATHRSNAPVTVAQSPNVAAPIASASPTASAPSIDAPLVPEETSFRTAITTLHAQIDPRLATLPAGKVKAIRVSLDALDAAIATTRDALAKNPDDPDLRDELDAEYEQEVQTLNDVLEWTTRT